MTFESTIEVATNEAMAILAGLEVLRDSEETAMPSILKAIKESSVRLTVLVDEIAESTGSGHH